MLCRFGLLAGGGGFGEGGFRVGQIGLQRGQAVALLEPHGCGGRGAGADGVAVPAPDRALAGDEDLAGGQQRLQRFAGILFDEAGLRQHTIQRRRAADKPVEAFRAVRQGRRWVEGRQVAPVPGGGRIGGGGEFFAQCRAERCFQAGGDLQRVDHGRPAFAVLDGEHLGECPHFGGEFGARGLGGVMAGARVRHVRLGRAAGMLGFCQCAARLGQLRFCVPELLFCRLEPGRIDGLGADPFDIPHHAGMLFGDAGGAGRGGR